MVTVVVGQAKQPSVIPKGNTVTSSSVPRWKHGPDTDTAVQPTPIEDKDKFVQSPPVIRPSPGINIIQTPEGEIQTRVTLRPGESSNLRWIDSNTFGGTITSPMKTEGIQPIPEQSKGRSLSQKVADTLGLSRMQHQEPFSHVETYGDKRYREKLLSSGIAEENISPREIGTFLVQTPSYVFTGATLKGVAGAVQGSKIGLRAFQAGSVVAGGAMIGLSAADIAATESKSIQKWKTFSLLTSVGLMAYGGKPSYFGYRYPATHLKMPNWMSKITKGKQDYGGFNRKPTVNALITEKTVPTTKPLPDPVTGKIMELSSKQTSTGMSFKKPMIEQTITGYKGYQGVKEIAKSPMVNIGKGSDIPPPTESGYANAMRYLVSEYGKPSKFTGFKRLEGGSFLESTEATGSLFPQLIKKTPVSIVSRTSPGKTLYWRGELIKQMNKPFTEGLPVVIPFTSNVVGGFSRQVQSERQVETQLSNQVMAEIFINKPVSIPRDISISLPSQRVRQDSYVDVVQSGQTISKQVMDAKTMAPYVQVKAIERQAPPSRLLMPGFGGVESKKSGGYRTSKKKKGKRTLWELPIPELKDLFGG